MSSLPSITQTELLGPDTKVKQGLKLTGPGAVTAFISTTNGFSFVTIIKVLPEAEPKALQIPLKTAEAVWSGMSIILPSSQPLGFTATSLYPL